ncbi:MAG: acyl carrier protein [Deltaproteobacteria bacterium RIFOXYA12_FULL_61_11]|nr:MAG: acyl carrier protein [Deltaproteobacteria bacterium RIFOXYA12_FULL_61_11]
MQNDEILRRLQDVFDQVFLEKIVVRPDLTAHEVEEWDSLLHVTLILYVELAFGVRFATGEIELTKNVGDLVDLIAHHTASER